MFISDAIRQVITQFRPKEEAPAPQAEAPSGGPSEAPRESEPSAMRAFRGASDFTARVESLNMLGVQSKGPTPEESREQADKDYEGIKEMFEKHPAHAPNTAVSFLGVHQSEPAYQAQMIKRLEADGLLEKLPEAREGVLSGKKNKDIISFALGMARIEKAITDDQIRELGSSRNAQQWREIGLAMQPQVLGIALAPGASTALEKVQTSAAELEKARGVVDGLDQQLAEEVGRLGPGLTDEQRQAYLSAFHDAHKDQYAALAQAEQGLDTALKAKALDDAALCDPDFYAPLAKAHEQLAQTPYAQTSIDWSKKVCQEAEKSPLLQERIAEGGGESYGRLAYQMSQKIVGPALQSLAGKFLQETDGDAAKALDKLFAVADQLKTVRDLKDALTPLKDVAPLLADLKNGKVAALKKVAEKWEAAPQVQKGALAGIYGLGVMIAAQKGKQGDYASMVKELATSSKGFLELSTTVMDSMAAAGRFGVTQNGAKKAATFIAERLAPGLGVLAAGASAWAHVSQYRQSNDPLHLMGALGDALSAMGEAASVFPPAYVPAKMAAALGTVISGGSDFAYAIKTSVQRSEEQQKLLERIGIPADVAKSLVAGDLEEIATRGKLSPTQVQAFLKDRLTFASDWTLSTEMLNTSEMLGLSGSNLLTLADRLEREGKRDLGSVAQQLKSIVSYGGGEKELRDFLRNNYPETYSWAEQQRSRNR